MFESLIKIYSLIYSGVDITVSYFWNLIDVPVAKAPRSNVSINQQTTVQTDDDRRNGAYTEQSQPDQNKVKRKKEKEKIKKEEFTDEKKEEILFAPKKNRADRIKRPKKTSQKQRRKRGKKKSSNLIELPLSYYDAHHFQEKNKQESKGKGKIQSDSEDDNTFDESISVSSDLDVLPTELFYNLIDLVPEVILVLRQANRFYKELLQGYFLEHFVWANLATFFHNIDAGQYNDAVISALKKPSIRSAGEISEKLVLEIRKLNTKIKYEQLSGQEKWLYQSLNLYYLFIYVKITGNKEEDALNSKEMLLQEKKVEQVMIPLLFHLLVRVEQRPIQEAVAFYEAAAALKNRIFEIESDRSPEMFFYTPEGLKQTIIKKGTVLTLFALPRKDFGKGDRYIRHSSVSGQPTHFTRQRKYSYKKPAGHSHYVYSIYSGFRIMTWSLNEKKCHPNKQRYKGLDCLLEKASPQLTARKIDEGYAQRNLVKSKTRVMLLTQSSIKRH